MKKSLLCYVAIIFLVGQILRAQSKVAIIDETKESIVRIFAFNIPFYCEETTFKTGTGYAVGDGSLILTSYQVIKEMNGLIVYPMDDSKSYYGTVVWSDSTTDVAVIKATDCNLKALEFADPGSVHLGDETLIFGYSGDNQTAEALKVTWGLVSTDSRDSTIQTTATVNRSGLGGPAINMQGKVIGTVHASNAGFSLENSTVIKNVRFAKDAVSQIKSDNSVAKTYFGTTSFDAYKKICDGAVQGWKSSYIDDLAAKESINATIYNLIIEALPLDFNYIEAFYFRAAYYLIQARYACLKNQEEDSKNLMLKFKGEIPEVDAKAKISNPLLLSTKGSFYNLRKQANLPEIKCADYNITYNNLMDAGHNRRNRIDEFNNYLITGKSPALLKKAVGGRSTSSNSGGGGNINFGNEGASSIFFMSAIDKARPVRFSVCIPFGFEEFNNNLGLSIGNAGSSQFYSVVFCKYQFSFDLIQDLHENTVVTQTGFKTYNYKRYLLPGFDIGISGNILRMARFNPKPYITIGYNPTFYDEKFKETMIDTAGVSNTSTSTVSKLYLGNGTFNFGIDVDLWITSTFGMSVTYQYSASFATFFPSMYGDDNRLQKMLFSTFKIGILF